MEIQGYRVKSEPMSFSLYDCDAILDLIEGLNGEEVIAVETSSDIDEGVMVYLFVREDGEQLSLGVEGL